MKILVPTDFSENAAQAFEFAKKLALLNGGKITLFFAYFTVYDFAAQAAKIIDQIETSANKAMEEIHRDQNEGVLVDHKIVHGAVASAITATAYKENYDLIVMGTQGASGIRKAFLGSNTANVIKESQTPVLAIPSGASFDVVREIVVAFEPSFTQNRSFKKLLDLTGHWGLPYKILYIENKQVDQTDRQTEVMEDYLKKGFPKNSFSSIHIINEYSVEIIEDYLKQVPGSLAVMFSRNKSFYEYLFNKNQAVKMAYHTHVPLLAIR